MSAARPSTASLADILDRVLNTGAIIDLWGRVSLVGVEILTVEARVVISSADTFLHYAKELSKIETVEEEGDLDDLKDIEIDASAERSSPYRTT